MTLCHSIVNFSRVPNGNVRRISVVRKQAVLFLQIAVRPAYMSSSPSETAISPEQDHDAMQVRQYKAVHLSKPSLLLYISHSTKLCTGVRDHVVNLLDLANQIGSSPLKVLLLPLLSFVCHHWALLVRMLVILCVLQQAKSLHCQDLCSSLQSCAGNLS